MRTPARSAKNEISNVASQASYKPLQYGLNEAELAEYHQNGYIVKRGLLADLAETLQSQASELLNMEELQAPNNLRLERAGDEQVVWKIDPFVDLHPFWGRMVRDRRICDVLASIYEGREPRLLKDKLIYKPPHTHGNMLHQDYTWWQGLPKSAISVCIAIDHTTIENGATTLYAGKHHNGLLHKAGEMVGLDPATVADVTPEIVCAEPGDAIFFGGFTPHEAGPNQTDGFRRQIFLSYNDSADGEWHAAHYDHFFSYRLKNVSEETKAQAYYL